MTDAVAHHYGVTVADLDAMVEFCREELGLAVRDRFTVSGEAFADAVGVEGAAGRFVHLDAGDTRIELVEYDPADAAAGDVRLDRPGATHLGLAVEDLDAVYAGLGPGVTTLSEPRTTESGTRILFVRDPEGNLVELLES